VVIRGFRHKGLRLLFETGALRGIRPAHAPRLCDILDLLNAAVRPSDMSFPGSFLHPLKGKLKGWWAVRVSGNWRVIFRFDDGNALDVDYIDYH
jgi:proteic killer suppression protein